jgi:hypothetical protein
MAVTINSLQLENVKRVKAFALEPNKTGLTIIGGKNCAGKSTVLHIAAWLLGGGKFAPSNPQRDGAMNPPAMNMTLSNGLVVERKGKNATLSVTDPSGKRHGQQLLDSFVSTFALDLTKFMNANDKEKAQILLQILGIGDALRSLDEVEQRLTADRRAFYPLKESKVKHAAELPEFADAPPEHISMSELIQQQQAIFAKNGENQRLRQKRERLELDLGIVNEQIMELAAKLQERREFAAQVVADLETAAKSTAQLQDESTAEIESSLANIENLNAQVSANEAKAKAIEEAAEFERKYDELGREVADVRTKRMELLNGAELPLPGLTVEEGILLYQNKAWDCMSGAQQLQVAVAIVRKLNPECGFVLIDKLEQFDTDTLETFGNWLVEQELQAIATRVSTGEECTIIIEDGLPAGQTYIETVAPIPAAAAVADNKWGDDKWD